MDRSVKSPSNLEDILVECILVSNLAKRQNLPNILRRSHHGYLVLWMEGLISDIPYRLKRRYHNPTSLSTWMEVKPGCILCISQVLTKDPNLALPVLEIQRQGRRYLVAIRDDSSKHILLLLFRSHRHRTTPSFDERRLLKNLGYPFELRLASHVLFRLKDAPRRYRVLTVFEHIRVSYGALPPSR